MTWPVLITAVYLLAINLIAVCLTIYDKKCAQKGRWRIPEATLLLVCAVGGAPGMYFTMKKIRHKTKKKKFMVGIPALFLLECAVAVVLTYLFHFR